MAQPQVYLPIPLPPLPQGLQGKVIFKHVPWPPPGSEDKSGSNDNKKGAETGAKQQGFSFGKALQGIKGEEDKLAYTSRGDGLFEGGSTISHRWVGGAGACEHSWTCHAREACAALAPQTFSSSGLYCNCRGNVVQLAPSALQPENAEKTLAELDRIAAAAGQAQKKEPAQRPKQAQVKYRSLHDAAEGLLNTLDDDDEEGTGSRNGNTAQQGEAGGDGSNVQGKGSSWSLESRQMPEHSLVEAGPDGKGPARLELHVVLPEAESAADAIVDIGAKQVGLGRMHACLMAVMSSMHAMSSLGKHVQTSRLAVLPAVLLLQVLVNALGRYRLQVGRSPSIARMA